MKKLNHGLNLSGKDGESCKRLFHQLFPKQYLPSITAVPNFPYIGMNSFQSSLTNGLLLSAMRKECGGEEWEECEANVRDNSKDKVHEDCECNGCNTRSTEECFAVKACQLFRRGSKPGTFSTIVPTCQLSAALFRSSSDLPSLRVLAFPKTRGI